MHYLFFDESYRENDVQKKIIIAGWAVEQDSFNRSYSKFDVPLRRPVLEHIDATLNDLNAWAVVGHATLKNTLFRSGEIDGTDDIPAMARPNIIWSTGTTFIVNTLIANFFKHREELGTIDIHYDPKSLKSDHEAAWRKTLQGLVVRHARDVTREEGSRLLKKLKVRRIEPTPKATYGQPKNKFQIGTWVAHKLCASLDEIQVRETSRIKSYDMSEEVRRTVQQFDGKSFEED